MARNSDFSWSLRLFLRVYQRQIRFFLRFAIFFLLMNFIYFLLADTFIQDFIFSSLTAKPAAAIIQFMSPGDGIWVTGNLLVSRYTSLRIIHGCEGVQCMLVITSAILAYKTSAMHKLAGVLCGVAFLYAVNLLRIVGVYFVVKYDRSALEVAHHYVGQTFVIMMMFAFFIIWVRRKIDGQERTD